MRVATKGAVVKTPHKIHIKYRVDYDRVRTGETVMHCGFRYPVNRIIPVNADMPLCLRCEKLHYGDTKKEVGNAYLHYTLGSVII